MGFDLTTLEVKGFNLHRQLQIQLPYDYDHDSPLYVGVPFLSPPSVIIY